MTEAPTYPGANEKHISLSELAHMHAWTFFPLDQGLGIESLIGLIFQPLIQVLNFLFLGFQGVYPF